MENSIFFLKPYVNIMEKIWVLFNMGRKLENIGGKRMTFFKNGKTDTLFFFTIMSRASVEF